MRLTAGQLAEALGVPAPTSMSDAVIEGVSTDSRTLAPGQVFFALQGENFDGHCFCDQALAQGAAALVVSDPSVADRLRADRLRERRPVLLVEHTLTALGRLAASWRQRFSPRVVAISGSCGKTTTKEMCLQVADRHFHMLATAGNFNNLIGLPLTLFGLKQEHTHALLELGMNQPGELAQLAEIVDAEGVALTNINYVHCGNFASLEAVRDAKAELIVHSPRARWVALNIDCPSTDYIRDNYLGSHHSLVTFGTDQRADFWSEDVQPLEPYGYRFRLCSRECSAEVELRVFGRANVQNAVCAAAILGQWQLDVHTIAEELGDFTASRWRADWQVTDQRVTVIADCYNASPVAVEDAVRSLAETKTEGRRVVVLGEMLELGAQAEALHQQVGKVIARMPVDLLVTIGELARHFAVEFGGPAQHFSNKAEAGAFLLDYLRPNDIALVKGSRSLALEDIVEILTGKG